MKREGGEPGTREARRLQPSAQTPHISSCTCLRLFVAALVGRQEAGQPSLILLVTWASLSAQKEGFRLAP